MPEKRALLTGIATGLIPTAIIYVDGYWNPVLGFFLSTSFGLMGWLYFRNRNRLSKSRWIIVQVLLVIGCAQFGIPAGFDLTGKISTTMSFLVLGIGWSAMLIGVEIGRTTPHHRN